VFISYQWDSKQTVLEVRNRLRSAGFKVWFDEDDMCKSLITRPSGMSLQSIVSPQSQTNSVYGARPFYCLVSFYDLQKALTKVGGLGLLGYGILVMNMCGFADRHCRVSNCVFLLNCYYSICGYLSFHLFVCWFIGLFRIYSLRIQAPRPLSTMQYNIQADRQNYLQCHVSLIVEVRLLKIETKRCICFLFSGISSGSDGAGCGEGSCRYHLLITEIQRKSKLPNWFVHTSS